MPNRLIFSLRFSSKVFSKLFLLAGSLVFFMTLFRLNLYLLIVFGATRHASFINVLESLWVGFRFDLLVFGFLFIPLFFVVIFQGIAEKWPRFMFVVYKTYFLACWTWVCILTYFDFFHFSQHGKRMRYIDYSSVSWGRFLDQFSSLASQTSWIFTIVTGLLVILGFSMTKSINFGGWKDEFSPEKPFKFEGVLRVLLPLLIISFAARGTIEEHHLRREHSEVSEFKEINEMALNAVWCFDK